GCCFGLGQMLLSLAQFEVLFVYMGAVSLLILATSSITLTSIRESRRPLFHIACWSTWAVFLAWFNGKASLDTDFVFALTFLGIFFVLFYAARVLQGKMLTEPSNAEGLLSILGNAFVFYGFALAI